MFSRFAEITIFAACDLTAFRSMRFSQQFSLLRLVPHRVRGIRVQIRKKSLDMISKQKNDSEMSFLWHQCHVTWLSQECHVTSHDSCDTTRVHSKNQKFILNKNFVIFFRIENIISIKNTILRKKNLILTKIPKNSWKFPLRLLKPQFEFWEIRAEHCVH